MGHVQSASTVVCMYSLHVPSACTYSCLHVPSACTICMYRLHVQLSARTVCMHSLHVEANLQAEPVYVGTAIGKSAVQDQPEAALQNQTEVTLCTGPSRGPWIQEWEFVGLSPSSPPNLPSPHPSNPSSPLFYPPTMARRGELIKGVSTKSVLVGSLKAIDSMLSYWLVHVHTQGVVEFNSNGSRDASVTLLQQFNITGKLRVVTYSRWLLFPLYRWWYSQHTNCGQGSNQWKF